MKRPSPTGQTFLVLPPGPLRVLAALGLLAFPLGLRALAPTGGEVAWAWAANGFASVVAAPLCALVALEAGSRVVLAAAAAAYALAGGLLWWVRPERASRSLVSSSPGSNR